MPAIRVRTRITMQQKKKKYRYPYLRIPAALKPYVAGRRFNVKVANGKVIYVLDENGEYKPIRYGNSLYIRFPLDVKESEADIIPVDNGFVVVLCEH